MGPSRSPARCARSLLAAGALLMAGHAAAAESQAFRACADPSNMPMVNEDGAGFENKIAELFAERLDLPLEYYWVPQQMGFGRLSLKKWLPEEERYACDVVLSAGAGFDVGQTTPAYFRSTYVMVFPEGTGLDAVETPEDLLSLPAEKRDGLRIGGFTKSPPVSWLTRHDMLDNLVGYRTQSGSRDIDPGDVIRNDLIKGDLDIVMLWGPIGGYYAQKIDAAKLRVVEFPAQAEGITFSFPIRMAVRYGEQAWLKTISGLIRDNRDQIEAILAEYNVPTLPLTETDKAMPEDDDD